jgi:hypothetical protein
MSVELFLDSGAFGIYNKLSRGTKEVSAMSSLKSRSRNKYSYVKSQEYKEYRKLYLAFLKQNQENFNVCANLDVIGSGELTYKNQKWFEKRGIKPTPVWHIDTDVSWLQKYIDEGYEYICIGAMVGVSAKIIKEVLDTVWTDHLTNNFGMPLLKVHGFGMTNFKLMRRYPWFSVDSKSWIDHARYGCVLYPQKSHGEYNWENPQKILVSQRKFLSVPNGHFNTQPRPLRKFILEYLKDEVGVPFGKSHFKNVDKDYKTIPGKENWYIKGKKVEVIEEPGISNSQACRMDINLYAYTKFEEQLPEWPWSICTTIKKRKGLF